MPKDATESQAAAANRTSGERRLHPRRPEEWPAFIRDQYADVVASGFTENLSDGGLRLVCKDRGRIPTEEILSVKICLLDRSGAVVDEQKHDCRVIYVQSRDDGKLAIGLEFLDP